jgi:hypothetical protein
MFLEKCQEKLPKAKVTNLGKARHKVIGQWTLIETIVSGRQLARWGVAGIVAYNKWYLFGGRGTDNYCRSSLHVVDLATLSITPAKNSRVPREREGHSCVLFNEWMVVFGGCDGGDEDTESLNDICIYDLKNKNWIFPQCRGKLPSGREGHAAGMIDHYMVVYGGNSKDVSNSLFSLNLLNFIWEEYAITGATLGHRESMAYTCHHNKLYIFGGNSSAHSDLEDEFNNDLYSLSLHEGSAICCELSTDGPVPPIRLSHSMCALDDSRLITYGGEGKECILSDVWVYNLLESHWREVVVSNTIPGRMSHILYAHSNRLLVFGGMNAKRNVINEIAILNVEDSIIKGSSPQIMNHASSCGLPRFICECGHSSSTCDFIQRFPEVSYPRLHFYPCCQLPLSYLGELCAKFADPLTCLLYITQQISASRCAIKTLGDVAVNCRGSIKPLLPPKQTLDLSFLPASAEDQTSDIRSDLLENWETDRDVAHARVLMVSGDLAIEPDLFLTTCVGTSRLNLIVPCLALSPTVVLVSKSKEYLCIALVTKEEHSLPCFSVVFDSHFKPVFPSAELFEANLSNILQRSSFSMSDFGLVADGLTVLLYCQGLETVGGDDLTFKKSRQSLLDFLKHCYFEAPPTISYTLQDSPVIHAFTHERCAAVAKFRSRDLEVYESSHCTAKLLVYFNNALIYTKPSSPEVIGTKRLRSADSTMKVVIVKSRRFMNLHSKQLDWSEELVSFFAALNSGDYSDI